MKINQLLEFGGLTDARIIAGKSGENNQVTSVSVLEVAETQIKTWVLKNQLYITSLYAIMQDIEKQKSVILALYENGAAGLVICHIDLFLKEVHQDIINMCNSIDFPIIVAKSERSYVEIINPIILKLSGDLNTETNDIINLQNKLIENIVTKKDINYTYRAMAKEYKGEIFFIDINQKILYPKYHSNADEIIDLVRNKQHEIEESSSKIGYYLIETKKDKRIIIGIQSNGIDYGFIVADYMEECLDRNLKMLRSFASLCTLIFTKSSKISEQEIIRKREYISDLLTWNFRSDEVALQMGKDIGWNIRNKGIMIIINLNNIQENINTPTLDYEKLINKVLYSKIKDIVKNENNSNLVGLRSDIFIILLENNDSDIKDRAKKLGEKLLLCCGEILYDSVSIGISAEIEHYKRIPEAYNEAMDAVRIGRHFFGSNKIVTNADIGFYGYIKEISQSNNFKRLKEDIVNRIKGYENENEDLYLTLKSYIYNNNSSEETAKELFVHKNTINYRKRKIVEILGYEPWKMPYLLNTIIVVVSDYFE